MPFRLNVFTGTLDLVTSPDAGDITGPPSSTDKAIVRWSGTTGEVINDSPNTQVQDSGALEAQGFITRRTVDDTVTVKDGFTWIAPSIEMASGGVIILEPNAQLIIE